MTTKEIINIVSQKTYRLMTTIGTLFISAGLTSYAINGKILPEGAVEFINHPIFPIVILAVYVSIILTEIFLVQR